MTILVPSWLREALLRLGQLCAFIVSHFVVAVLIAGLGFAGHHFLRTTLGDPTLFDSVPWRYVFDMMDIAVILIVLALGVAEAVRLSRGEP